jgi:drug/metabolite transporter (DMT)-like permease
MLSGGAFQFGMAALSGEFSKFDAAAISLASVLGVLYLIVCGSLIALNCYLWLLTRVSAPKVTTYALVNPVVALLLGAMFLGESVTPLAMGAAVLVLVGVALVLSQDIRLSTLLRNPFGRGRSESSCRSPKSESA